MDAIMIDRLVQLLAKTQTFLGCVLLQPDTTQANSSDRKHAQHSTSFSSRAVKPSERDRLDTKQHTATLGRAGLNINTQAPTLPKMSTRCI